MVNRDEVLGGDRIVYNPATVEVVNQGYRALAGSNTLGIQRHVSWATFRQKANGKQFLFVNTHFEPRDGAKLTRIRASAARQLVAAITEANPDGLPMVVVGDFNSGGLRRPGNAVYQTIVNAGLKDPLRGRAGDPGTAKKLIQANLKTFNDYQRKPRWDADAPMSDYMFVSPMRVAEWETVARLDRSGRFIGTIPSDHNMIRLTVYLP
jgi:endonuclease/exonuclease/phosphatase family metal-dependent hydrolase